MCHPSLHRAVGGKLLTTLSWGPWSTRPHTTAASHGLLHALAQIPALEHSDELFAAQIAYVYLHAGGIQVEGGSQDAITLVVDVIEGRGVPGRARRPGAADGTGCGTRSARGATARPGARSWGRDVVGRCHCRQRLSGPPTASTVRSTTTVERTHSCRRPEARGDPPSTDCSGKREDGLPADASIATAGDHRRSARGPSQGHDGLPGFRHERCTGVCRDGRPTCGNRPGEADL